MLKLVASLTAGFFLACWVVYLLAWAGEGDHAGRLPLALYPLYSAASALGWGAGMVYVQLTRPLPRRARRRTFLLSFFAPPGLLFLLWALTPTAAQQAAPLVPLYALGVFAILFAVPVSMRHIGRGPVEPGSR